MNLIERKITQHMVKAILERVFSHWKTTSAGAALTAVVLGVMLNTYQSGMTWKQWLLAAIPAVVGAILKDNLGSTAPTASALLLALLSPGLLCAQTPAPAPAPTVSVNSFSITAAPISLPGKGSSTLGGALTGVTLGITTNFALRQTNFVSSDSSVKGFLGGIDYAIAPFSKWLNNISPNLNGYNFRLELTGSAGSTQITGAGSHWGFLAGGRLSYAIAGSKNYNLALEVQDLNTPGLAKRNNVVVSVGPTISW